MVPFCHDGCWAPQRARQSSQTETHRSSTTPGSEREYNLTSRKNRHQYNTHPTAYGTSVNPTLTSKASVPPIQVAGRPLVLLWTNCWRNVYSLELCTEARLAPERKQYCCSVKEKIKHWSHDRKNSYQTLKCHARTHKTALFTW